MRSIRLPGRAAHAFAWLLTMALTLCLTLTCLTWQANRLLTDTGLHEDVALDEQVAQAQMARIEKKVNELAQTYSFQPETVMALVDCEALTQYSREVIAWWMGLMQENPSIEVPGFDTGAIETAVREDPLFQESTAANLRRTIARDEVAYQVGLTVKRTVLPVRADILSAVMPKLMEKINLPALAHLVALAPLLCGIAATVAALALLLLMHKRLSKAGLYIGAGLAAAGICSAGLLGLAGLLNIGGMVAEINSLLALQLDLLMGQVMLQVGLCALVALAAGMGLIAYHQHDIHRLCRRRRPSKA